MNGGFPWRRRPCDNNAMSSLNTPIPGPAPLSRRFSIAPMMAYTTRDFRYLARLITRRTLLYTEMVVAPAVIHGDRDRLLGFDAAEHPRVEVTWGAAHVYVYSRRGDEGPFRAEAIPCWAQQ